MTDVTSPSTRGTVSPSTGGGNSSTSVSITPSTRSAITMPKINNSRSKDQVRSRLLNNLGIFNNVSIEKAPNPAIARKIKIIRAMGLGGVIPPKPLSSQSPSLEALDNENIRPKINFSEITHEPLKYKDDDIVDSNSMEVDEENGQENGTTNIVTVSASTSSNQNGTQNQTSTETKKKKNRRKICFNDSVKVAHIPMRSEYSDRVRSRIWSNRYEIHENATRNAIEFQAEGWDWRTTVEDEGMFVCTSSGELIHPVHCQQ